MRKIFTFMLLAAALLVSVPSWAQGEYVEGVEKNLGQYNFPLVPPDLNGEFFGTLCFPERIVATQGIKIWDVICVDKLYNDGNNDGNLNTTPVARLVVLEHTVCYGYGQDYYDGHKWHDAYLDEPFCPYEQGTGANSCDEKVYIDWAYNYDEATQYDYRMKAGAAYFYQVCNNGADSLKDRKIWVDTEDVASAPVCQNGFYGTFTDTKVNEPVTLLTMAWSEIDGGKYVQQLEQVTSATIPAHRGYFKGNFECVPWRWNTDNRVEDYPYGSQAPNPLHYSCTGEVKAAPRNLSNAVAFNVGPRDVTTGLYPIDLEHPIYLGKETNKRIENGQLILEAADGTKYNAFGQRVK